MAWKLPQAVIDDDLQQMNQWVIENQQDAIMAISETANSICLPDDAGTWEQIAFPAFLAGARFALETLTLSDTEEGDSQ